MGARQMQKSQMHQWTSSWIQIFDLRCATKCTVWTRTSPPPPLPSPNNEIYQNEIERKKRIYSRRRWCQSNRRKYVGNNLESGILFISQATSLAFSVARLVCGDCRDCRFYWCAAQRLGAFLLFLYIQFANGGAGVTSCLQYLIESEKKKENRTSSTSGEGEGENIMCRLHESA